MMSVHLALRFLLELCALAALGYWGLHAVNSGVTGIVLMLAVPLLFSVAWGLFVAPKSAVAVPAPVKWLLGLVLLEIAAAALLASHPALAAVFGALIVINAIPLHPFKRQKIER